MSIARPGTPAEFKPLPQPHDAPGRSREDDDGHRRDGELHRARRDRHDEPRDLSERDPARSDGRSGRRRRSRRPGAGTGALSALHGIGLSVGLVHPGWRHGRGRRARCGAARRGLCDLHQHAQSSDQQLQCGRCRRDGDDGQGTLHRNIRRAVLHDQRRRIGRRVHEPADRRRVAGTSSTASTSARRSRTRCRSRSRGSTRIS